MRKFLTNCSRIETLAGKIYQHLANEQSYAEEVCKVFENLSNDERAHALHIDLVLQGDEKEVVATPMIAGEKANEEVTFAEATLQMVEREAPNEEDALRLAVALEERFLKVHVNNALNFDNPRLAELFNKLGNEDETHLNTLRNCLKWWHAERKQQLAGG